jgi:4-hydroxy-tetrahydrodipicolinate reductase
MGRCTLELASYDERFTVMAALTDRGCPTCGTTIRVGGQELTVTEKMDAACEVLIDFTTASGTMAWLDVCKRLGIPMVIGATGHDADQLALIHETARVIPIVKAVNFSVGVQKIIEAAARLAKELGAEYDIEVTETHHRHKIDAPSGTALAIVDEILRATKRTTGDHVVFGRQGETGPRPPGQIGVHSLRLGDTIGRHEVHFSGHGETITLQHTVHTRETFAAGALRAAAWIVGKDPGLYSMSDLLS